MCSVQGCDGGAHVAGMCWPHYRRQWEQRKAENPCTVLDCDRGQFSRGWCRKHYKRWHAHGDPTYTAPPKVRKPKPAKPKRSLSTSYRAVHLRVTKQRGRAAEHACAHCGDQARDWAYDHSDPHELTCEWYGNQVSYSADIHRYQPLCRTCHNRMDSPYKGSVLQQLNIDRAVKAGTMTMADPLPRPVTQW